MLVDQIMTNDMRRKNILKFIQLLVIGGRVPKMDEDTLEILSEEALVVYLNYLDQLKHIFNLFVHPNFNAGKKVIITVFNI